MIDDLQTYHFALLSIPKIQTDLLWYLTYLFAGLGFTYFVFVFFFKNRLSKRSAQVAEKKRELAPMISQFLFHSTEDSFEDRKLYLCQKVEIRELIKSRFNRSVLAEILLDLQKDVSGEARKNLYELYQSLGLHHDAFAKLKSWRWEVISQGILELTQMRVEESYMFLKRFINHPRGVIRKQAQIAAVTLKHEGISFFLDTARYHISEWQQLKLLDVLRNLEDFNPPRFKIWLTSRNNDVVLFSLRLIRYYNQNDAIQAIIQLIKHRNNHIKAEAIQCLKEFGVVESIETLKTAFRRCNTDIKILILDAIGTLGNESNIGFLEKVEKSDLNFTVKSKAISAINTIDPERIMPSAGIEEPSKADIRFAKEPAAVESQENLTDINTVEMAKEYSEEDEAINTHELEVENEEIFDLCCVEEFRDILEEVHQEEEPDYLPLNFLPIVECETKANVKENKEGVHKTEICSEHIAEEEKIREDLNTIINNIAMSENQKRPKINEELPDFLPLVVGENKVEEDQELPNQSTQLSLDLELEGEILDQGTKQDAREAAADEETDPKKSTSIYDTPVVAETTSWEDMLGISPGPDHTLKDTDEKEDDMTEELQGFSIFHEMFRDFDVESKLILLDEILVVGEEKELCFLATLSNDPDKRVRNKALKIKKRLAEKLESEKQVECDDVFDNESDPEAALIAGDTKQITESQLPNTEVVPKAKIPLEYCFYDSEDEDMSEFQNLEAELDLELEGARDQDSEQMENQEEVTEVEEKRNSIIDNLLSFTAKLRDRRNG